MADLTLMLEIEGMTSEESSRSIHDALMEETGVRDVQVDWCCGVGVVVFDANQTDQERILDNAAFRQQYKAKIVAGGCC